MAKSRTIPVQEHTGGMGFFGVGQVEAVCREWGLARLQRTDTVRHITIGSNRYLPTLCNLPLLARLFTSVRTFSKIDVMLEPPQFAVIFCEGGVKGNRVHVLRGAPRWPGSTDTGHLSMSRRV